MVQNLQFPMHGAPSEETTLVTLRLSPHRNWTSTLGRRVSDSAAKNATAHGVETGCIERGFRAPAHVPQRHALPEAQHEREHAYTAVAVPGGVGVPRDGLHSRVNDEYEPGQRRCHAARRRAEARRGTAMMERTGSSRFGVAGERKAVNVEAWGVRGNDEDNGAHLCARGAEVGGDGLG
ncbi:hypothetical protein EVG20_g9832 [Dentipellis fragilis]|uniref:Uncharacterized protein n=1 Tax=Dentipellis fragilis TaxID=205917 RepID=A0A4Y9XWH2_9AGAM|nr:hypothetical protein EVG20_g9832 [Dentipellis fragilis]